MDTQSILNIVLVLHLIALSMAIGITVANYVAFQQIWKLYDSNKEQGLAAFRSIAKFRLVGIIGLLLLIVSGITMLYLFQWTLTSLLWFKIKLFIVLLIFVNGFTMGRIENEKLDKFLSEERQLKPSQTDTAKLKRHLQIFNLTQLLLFVLIIILSIFRFN
jgi:hypothetical protein